MGTHPATMPAGNKMQCRTLRSLHALLAALLAVLLAFPVFAGSPTPAPLHEQLDRRAAVRSWRPLPTSGALPAPPSPPVREPVSAPLRVPARATVPAPS